MPAKTAATDEVERGPTVGGLNFRSIVAEQKVGDEESFVEQRVRRVGIRGSDLRVAKRRDGDSDFKLRLGSIADLDFRLRFGRYHRRN
ncbi:unnamed protein product [Linum trigynum]|uniref:Uncharacterized protein n=1 Tax=Linum trigynum TaxID=586398 RepID=A0AAV2FAH0_9ROSI